MRILSILFLLFSTMSFGQNPDDSSKFFETKYDENTGKVSLTIAHLDRDFLYINYIGNGIGSNDIGLDRGKIMDTRLVKFIKEGNKILLLQPNQEYRANSSNLKEVNAIEEAFARSVLWAFDVESKDKNGYIVDLTPFLLNDANRIPKILKDKKQGSYKLDNKRSVVRGAEIHSFPRNTEFESMLTFVGEAKGRYIRSVAPSSDAVTIVQHQSFVALPEDGYQPRVYHPFSGYFNTSYYDYATPIHQPLEKRFIVRHRLEKTNPKAALSPAKEPIIYYVDAGCPEPVKSALIEGASWWNQAFTEAGFKDAFQVKELPDGAHPLDVRYNVIQWVHRSTRGWSYGASIVDPRTGEIIKGHVSLGSLRVRQDFMIAQGILSPYSSDKKDHSLMTKMALARLRQLSAHEVGHTIGLAHNFAASCNDRASVMDYPHPFITMQDGSVDMSNAYDDKIGAWDKRAIVYGYAQTETGAENADFLASILKKTHSMNLDFMSDPDARPAGSAHPKAHLWDNGSDPIIELQRMMNLRKFSLSKFGINTIPQGTPYSELEKVVVPVYLMHRYQTEAVSKLIGGVDYSYAVKGDQDLVNKTIAKKTQQDATRALLNTLTADALAFPSQVLNMIPPSAYGYNRSRESFKSNTNLVFDPLTSAEAYSNYTLKFMLNPDRLARMNVQEWGLDNYLQEVVDGIMNTSEGSDNYKNQLAMIVQKTLVVHLIKLANQEKGNMQVAAVANQVLSKIDVRKNYKYSDWKAHQEFIKLLIKKMKSNEQDLKLPGLAEMPPGSPIGC